MKVWSDTQSELEDSFDLIKTTVLRALVEDKLLSLASADDWCATHTLILREKTLWRTLTERWKKMTGAQDNSLYITVVSAKVEEPS